MYKNLKQKIIFGLAAVLVSQLISAQVAYYNFNSSSGLPSNETYCVMQDRAGYMWFGTDHGVVRYDGYKFKTFTNADGLTDNTVFSIKEDEEGRLWFLTLAGGICYYDGKVFAPHPNNDTIVKLCNKRFPVSWKVLRNKELWLGLLSYGFYKVGVNKVEPYLSEARTYSTDSTQFYVLTFPDSDYIYTSIVMRKMASLPREDIISIDSFSLCYREMRYTDMNFSLLKLSKGKMLISQWRNFVYLNDNKIEYEIYLPSNKQISEVKRTSDHKIWMVNQNTTSYSINIDNGIIGIVDSLFGAHSGSDILLDRQGNYWLTSLDNGVYFIPDKKIRIFTGPNINPAVKVSGFASNNEFLYVGLPEGKFLKIDQHMKFEIVKGQEAPSAVSSFFVDKTGAIISNNTMSGHWGLVLSYLTKIVPVKNDRFVVGGVGGIAEVEGNNIFFDSRKTGFSKRVTELCRIGPNKYLVGTLNGLYYYTDDGAYVIKEEPILKDTRITSCQSISTSTFAVATRGKGIYYYKKEHFYRIKEGDGLNSDLVENLYFENDSVLWAASFKGLSKIQFHFHGDSLSTSIRSYTKEDGLCSDQINSITLFNGYLWLATNEGLCFLTPSELSADTLSIPLYFGNILVNGSKRSVDSLNLKYYQNNLLIEFNALYFKALSGIRYKVRLKGVDAWKYTNQNFIQYFNLQPGEYLMEVAAEDKFGKYKSEIRSLHFTIQPRFIDTVFFKSLVFLLIFLVMGIIVYTFFNLQRVKAKNVIKLLQAEFKALNYQINPHFIFNVLNSIQYYILRKDSDNAVHMLSSFSMLIRKIVNNSKQQYVSILEEVECLKEYMDLEKVRLENKFEYEINIDSSIELEKKEILPMIIQPLVENSIWHGIVPANRQGKITIDFKKVNGQILCIVEDNGVGINNIKTKNEKSQNSLSLAMKNVSERLKIISELNNSTWAVKTEDKSNFVEKGTGTIVTVIFPALKEN